MLLLIIPNGTTAIIVPNNQKYYVLSELSYCGNQNIDINTRKPRALELLELLKTFRLINYDNRN